MAAAPREQTEAQDRLLCVQAAEGDVSKLARC
jgi:hypothetical protein